MTRLTLKILAALFIISFLITTSAEGQSPRMVAPDTNLGFTARDAWEDISPHWLQGTCPTQIAFKPGSPDQLWLGTCFEGLLYSYSLGETWYREYIDFWYDDTIPSWWIRDILFNPQNPTQGIAVTMSGTFWTDDGGLHWHKQGSPRPEMSHMAINSPDNSLAISSDYMGRIWRYHWNAHAWDSALEIHYGQSCLGISFDQSNPEKLYIASGFSGMLVSEDLGLSYYYLGTGLPKSALVVVADPVVPDMALAASGPNLYRTLSPASKPFWFTYGAGLPGTNILCMVHDPANPDRVFAGLVDRGVYVSLDRGANWKAIPVSGMGVYTTVADLGINPEQPEFLYAVSHQGGASDGALFRIQIR
jgi:hypothetical protein